MHMHYHKKYIVICKNLHCDYIYNLFPDAYFIKENKIINF